MKRAKKTAARHRRIVAPYVSHAKEPKETPEAKWERMAEEVIRAICDLGCENPYMMAAVVDWVRLQWRGEPKVIAEHDAVSKALSWVRARRQVLTSQAMRDAMENTLRTAVAS